MRFLNTRPASRSQSLTHALQGLGLQVLDLPLLALQPTPVAPLIPLVQQLPQMACIVVVSPTAAELGMQALQAAGIPLSQLAHIQWIAVGQGTARYLQQWHIEAHVPEIETSEGMLQLPYLQQLHAAQGIAFWRGEGGRTFMMQQLKAQGHAILNLVLYVRHLPESSSARFLSVVQQGLDVVLISSEASWRHWCDLIERFEATAWLQRVHYIVLGPRLYHIIRTQVATGQVHQVETLEINVIQHCLTHIEKSQHE